MRAPAITLGLALALFGCKAPAPPPSGALVARLGDLGGDPAAVDEIGRAFAKHNPGYELGFDPALEAFESGDDWWVLLVTRGDTHVGIRRAGGTQIFGQVQTGDAVLLRPGEGLLVLGAVSALAFRTPGLPHNVPTIMMSDHDAAEASLLGPETFPNLNAFRTSVADMPTHYHPLVGGYDELFVIQDASTLLQLHWTEDVAALRTPNLLNPEEARTLIQTVPLLNGDLVYIPRGTAHRIEGSARSLLVTVPAIAPEARLVVDEEIRALNARFAFEGDRELPALDPVPAE